MHSPPIRLLLAAALAGALSTGCVVPNPAYDPGAGADTGAGTGALQDGEVQTDSVVLGQLAEARPPDTKQPTTPKPPPTPTGGGLCDPCEPKVGSCTIPGGLCLIIEGGESFCTKPCSKTKPCPKGYDCMSVTVIKGTASPLQCVPPSLSCKK